MYTVDPAMSGIRTHKLSPLSKIGSLLNNNKNHYNCRVYK